MPVFHSGSLSHGLLSLFLKQEEKEKKRLEKKREERKGKEKRKVKKPRKIDAGPKVFISFVLHGCVCLSYLLCGWSKMPGSWGHLDCVIAPLLSCLLNAHRGRKGFCRYVS